MSNEQKIVASAEFMKLLESARSFMGEGWRVVPGSVQCLTEYWKPKSSERVETLSRFVLLMERPEEEVQVVQQVPDCYDFTQDDFNFDQARDRGEV